MPRPVIGENLAKRQSHWAANAAASVCDTEASPSPSPIAAIIVARKGRTLSLQRLRILSEAVTISSHDSLDEASYVKMRQIC
jgi:hypothetical protein